MVKNLDTKEIWKFSKSFVKREGILLLACVLAVASSLAVVPKAEYIDWRVLVLLYCLMLVVGGFKKRRVLDNCAVRLLQRCISLRQITAALLLITFISSMLVTNDVALITFVPLTLIIGKEAGVDVGKIIVWQTLAANLGSMLTPMGNPQNLFLYARYNFDIIAFFKVTWIPTCLAVALLAVFLMRQQDRQLKVSLTSVNVECGWGLIVLNLLFLLCVVTVFHWFDHWLLLGQCYGMKLYGLFIGFIYHHYRGQIAVFLICKILFCAFCPFHFCNEGIFRFINILNPAGGGSLDILKRLVFIINHQIQPALPESVNDTADALLIHFKSTFPALNRAQWKNADFLRY